jgi:N-acetylgalactosamine kinase
VQEVAQFTAECEKFVGTESGGMDQAISIMGELGMAKLVHFHPVRPTLILLLSQ